MDVGRRPRRCPAPTSRVNAPCSSPPHRHASEPNTSPVRHSTWTCSGTGTPAPAEPMMTAKCSPPSCASRKPMTRESPAQVGRIVSASRITCGSVRRRYATSSAIETTASPYSSANSTNSAPRAISVGLRRETISQSAAAGRRPASRARSTAASAGPRRAEHPVRGGPHRDHVTRPEKVRGTGLRPTRVPRWSWRGLSPRFRCPFRDGRPTRSGWCRGGTSVAGSVARIRQRAARRGHSPRYAGR